MKTGLIWALGIVVVAAIALGAWWYISKDAAQEQTAPSADTAAQSVQARDNSNDSLNQDMSDLDAQMSALGADASIAAESAASAQ